MIQSLIFIKAWAVCPVLLPVEAFGSVPFVPGKWIVQFCKFVENDPRGALPSAQLLAPHHVKAGYQAFSRFHRRQWRGLILVRAEQSPRHESSSRQPCGGDDSGIHILSF